MPEGPGQAAVPAAPAGAGPVPRRGPSGRRTGAALVLSGLLLAAVVVVALVVGPPGGGGGGAGASGGPAPGVSQAASDLLQLDVLAPSNRFVARAFTLTDQYGHPVRLGQFRGRPVVLSFNDDRCPDLCTLLAQDIVLADRYMGAAARRVVFLSVNVNPFYPQVRYVRSWTASHGLGQEPNWYFGTASVDRLHAVWKAYGVYVSLDRRARTVVHSTDIYFISPSGHVVAVGQFGTNAASTALFAHSMAQMAVDLLPPGERGPVSGPAVPPPSLSNATVGAPAPSFGLPRLGRQGGRLSSRRLSGHWQVLNFWSSTCSACTAELPQVEQAHRDLGKRALFVGVDVTDRPGAALALARRAGLTYPLVSDANGTLSGAYRVPGLPFTAIVGPNGDVVVRHPGAITTEQLDYIVRDLAQSPGA